jgi:hypothetical protein
MIGGGSRVLGLARVFHKRNIATISINNIGHSLEPAIRKGNKVFALSVSAGPALLVAKIIVGGTIIHGIFPGVLGISLKKKNFSFYDNDNKFSFTEFLNLSKILWLEIRLDRGYKVGICKERYLHHCTQAQHRQEQVCKQRELGEEEEEGCKQQEQVCTLLVQELAGKQLEQGQVCKQGGQACRQLVLGEGEEEEQQQQQLEEVQGRLQHKRQSYLRLQDP